MNTTKERYESLEEFLAKLNMRENLSKSDKMFLQSVVKRQRQVIADLIEFDKRYPKSLDRDIVGGLYSIYTLLDNQAQSLILG
ncbi:MAG: hypothetical protein ACI4MI_00910 [Christensenellales bacterium]